jgi:hypothetical protein
MPQLPLLKIAHPFGSRRRDEIAGLARECIAQLRALTVREAPAVASRSVAPPPPAPGPCARVEVADDLEAIQQLFRSRRWDDGLPVIPPTIERVKRMLTGTSLAPGHMVASVAPGFGLASVEAIAVNAVAAGCAPEHLPLVIAAVEAACAEQFNLQAIAATTNSVAVWVVVNGPIARTLHMNAGINCLGQGNYANAAIGRAVHLVLQNIGGALPGEMDRATHGQPGKFSFCCAENEADSPWQALHVERGFARDASTVTVVGAEGTMNMNSHAKDANQLLQAFADTMQHPPSNEYTHGGEPWLILSPEHAAILHGAGLGKADVKRELWSRSKLEASRMTDRDLARVLDSRGAELGAIGPDTMLPIAKHADDICIVVAGGPGTHSVYVPCFGNSLAVTVAVQPR